MFGTYRYILAHFVVLGHLFPAIFWPATYAVFAFYMLSGYLMTKVVTEVYGITPRGVYAYFANRFFRIYPLYWAVLLCSLVTIAFFPYAANSVNRALTMPDSAGTWISNILIFGLGDSISSGRAQIRLVPQAWALHIELIFYVLIPFIGSSKRSAVVWFLLSLVYSTYLANSGAPWVMRYRPLQAASLPFSAGALLYHLSGDHDTLRMRMSRLLLPALALYCINIAGASLWADVQGVPFYINVLLASFVILSLSAVPKVAVPQFIRRVDKFLGDLSYPIYLVHYWIAVLVVIIFFNGDPSKGMRLFLVALPFVNGASLLMHFSLDGRINAIRDRIRGKKIAF